MHRELSSCAHDSSSSDTKSGSDGGNRGGPGAVAGISGFRILDVHNLRVGEDGTDLEPDSIVVVKVEPKSQDDFLSQGETSLVEAGCLLGNDLRTSNDIRVKEEPNEDSFSADEKSTRIFSSLSCTKNVQTITERSLQQDQKNHCAKSKDYEQKSNHDQNHKRTPAGEKLHKCTICNQSFTWRSTCVEHMRAHAGDKPYKCNVCDKSFVVNYKCLAHMRTHSGEKPYDCNICKKSFTQRSSCQVHMRIHTGEKPYKCTVCNKAFSHCSSYHVHMRIHTGEKPYKCHVCNKVFTQWSTCHKHQQIHTTYKCSVCSEAFDFSSNLHRHQRIHTDHPTML